MTLAEGPASISFWLSGQNLHSTEGEVVCPAWMIPPTEIELPTMVFCSDEREEDYSLFKLDNGHTIRFAKSYLKFNQHEQTPVVVKKIGDKIYAVLMREHLHLVKLELPV